MRLLVVTSEYGEVGGGLSTAASRFTQMLEMLGINYDLYINEIKSGREYTVVGGGYNPKLEMQLYTGGIIKSLKSKYVNKDIDYVVAFGAGENGLFSRLLADEIGSKLIVMLRGSDINLAAFDERQYYTNFFCLQNASAVIALSNELVQNAKRILNRSDTKYFVIPNSYDLETSHSRKADTQSKKVVIGTGAFHLNEKKGVGNLLNVMKYLNEKYNDFEWNLELVGLVDHDLLENYRNLISKLNIENRVSFLGNMTREMFKNQISNWDLYVQCSVFEGYSNSVVEAISVGTPVILSNTGFFAEHFKDKFPEIVFHSFYPEEIAEKIFKFHILDNKNSMVGKYTEVAKSLINTRKVYNQWKEVFVHLSGSEEIESVMFHDVNNSYTGVDYAVEGFNNLVDLVKQKGYELCSVRDYFSSLDRKNKIICTFDDGYKGVYQNALPILSRYGFTATVFVCPDLIGKQNDWNHKDPIVRQHMVEDELNELVANGWEIGSHGLNHVNLKRYSESELLEMLFTSKEMLEKNYGNVTSFCYPFGEYNDFISNTVGKVYSIAFSTNNGGTYWRADRYSIKRFTPEKLKRKLGMNV